jgi:formylglycine-generating enzyme required for sulfatase activity
MPLLKSRTLRWVIGLAILAVLFYIAKVSWYDRYVWRGTPAHMLDLPPQDRSDWPPATEWQREVQAVEVATPQGLQVKEIAYHVNSLGMDFVRIKAGSFRPEPGYRTYSAKWPLRRAPHLRNRTTPPRITLSRDYYLGAFEVTNTQFEQFDPAHKARRPKHQRGANGDHHPAAPVTWREAQRFARWLSKKEGRVYRLPTEAEWEYAAAAGTRTRLYWGDDFDDRTKANLGGLHSNKETLREDGYKKTAPVGMFAANPWGLYDTIGNAYEWVQDWWHPNLEKDAVDPIGPARGKIRMGKGGSWTTRHYAIYTGEDDGNNPADLRDERGFRLLVEIEPATSQYNKE